MLLEDPDEEMEEDYKQTMDEIEKLLGKTEAHDSEPDNDKTEATIMSKSKSLE